MRPAPIPDEEVWEGARRVVIAGPDGDLTGEIQPAEVLVHQSKFGPCISARVILQDGDLERLEAGEPFWVTFIGDHLHPFDVGMTE
jgi:hypothetical protein